MRRAITIAFCIVFVAVLFPGFSAALDVKSLKGQELYTRSNLKTKGSTVFFHNMSRLAKNIPPGTPVKITNAGNNYIRFKVLDTRKKYVIKGSAQYYNKFFVENPAELGLDKMDEKVMKNVRNMKAAEGMTKKEVFTAKGCPAYIAYGEKSLYSSLDQIMDSDTWYYNMDSRRREVIITFENDIVNDVKARF